ncbi:glycosyltransferase family protein [Afifella sp. IM 167]|uniref:glycosyltransferase family protein n=1 Tax=Afifella sp. IM 167 TaxID=2033586 RepID=UPI001CCB2C04|nr:glycosyltransferase [Afifella sp. IM 167]MBZ8133167.1 glycosyltransferase [Afifella sp. IM 167]
MKALIWVQHLLGTGHSVRAGAIARALRDKGVAVTLATGARLPASVDTSGIEIVALPPAHAADNAFSAILDEHGRSVDETWWEKRRRILLETARRIEPDILLTEAFPLARRAFRAELLPLISEVRAARRKSLVAASVRDILVRKPPEKEGAMAELALARYDAILVHSDPAFVRLEDSFGAAGRLAGITHYTGYVSGASAVPAPPGIGEAEIIVSCGGGAVGRAILDAAIAARAHSRKAGHLTWRILAGANLPEADFSQLAAAAPEGVIVERARPDFPDLLKRARLSVSQAGYNTAVDILAAGVAAVFVPFAEGSESEQTQRAELLTKGGLAVLLPEARLSPETLAGAIDEAMALHPPRSSLRLDGARESARYLISAAGEKR